jgi:TatD-related deoxyribonuclease
MAQKVGLPADHVVKHFSPPLITHTENHGLFPSIVSTKKNIVTALKKGTRFLMETDYIDDIRRPGAVLGPRTVPQRTRALLNHGLMTAEQSYEIHVTNPERVYNLVLE